jgi:hypothetical protein
MKNKQDITVLLSRFVAAVSACTRYCIRILQYTDMGDMDMGNTNREKNGRHFIIRYILFICCPLKYVAYTIAMIPHRNIPYTGNAD